MLFTNQNKLITKQLLDKNMGHCWKFVNDNTLTVYIKKNKRKIRRCNSL